MMELKANEYKRFEDIKHVREDGTEYWSARELAPVLEFEDCDFLISMLETETDACIEVIKEPLILYRTAAASSNVRSMDKRIELMRYLIQKHKSSYEKNVEEAVLGVEQISINRLFGWESEMVYHENLSEESKAFLKNPTYGDGGMAAAVRVNSYKKN